MAADDAGVPDLDRLIGEAEAEAARRRAAPGYPHQLEARIDAELARFGPIPPRHELEHLITGVEEASFVNADAPTAARWRGLSYLKVVLKKLLSWYVGHVTEQISVLGLLTARALAAVTGRLEALDGRVRRLEGADAGRTIDPRPRPSGGGSERSAWLDELPTLLATVDGRILYADADVEAIVARLRAAGLDTYGLTADDDTHRSSPDVRRGQLLAHLDAVADRVLAAVVLAGWPDAMDGGSLRGLIHRLQRVLATDGRVVIVGEAPWWWQERLGPVEADLSDGRPFTGETWIAAFSHAGFSASGRYATDGRSYCVEAQRRVGPNKK